MRKSILSYFPSPIAALFVATFSVSTRSNTVLIICYLRLELTCLFLQWNATDWQSQISTEFKQLHVYRTPLQGKNSANNSSESDKSFQYVG